MPTETPGCVGLFTSSTKNISPQNPVTLEMSQMTTRQRSDLFLFAKNFCTEGFSSLRVNRMGIGQDADLFQFDQNYAVPYLVTFR
jgi:hypothetical protein